jgi:hypothetical protein
LAHIFTNVKVDCLIELPFRQIFFFFSSIQFRNRKIAEIIQSQDHHALAALKLKAFLSISDSILQQHNKTVCEQLMKRKKNRRKTRDSAIEKRHEDLSERKGEQRKKKINFYLSKFVINGSLDCIANSLRPTMIRRSFTKINIFQIEAITILSYFISLDV